MALLLTDYMPRLALALALIAIIAVSTHALLNLINHPLSCYPGPRLWACSRVPYVLALQKGTLITKIKALHDIYGPVVRVAPNELSFIAPKAYKDIYTSGFERDEIFYGVFGLNSIFGAGHEDHARMRGVLSPRFRASAMKTHEERVRKYVHILVEQLGMVAKQNISNGRSDSVGQDEFTVDIVRWMNFISFDIVGNFVYGGEPFGCLRRGEFHSWVGLIYTWLETAAKFSSIRYYTSMERVLLWLVPLGLIKQKEEFERLGRDSVRKRMLSAVGDGDEDKVEAKKGFDRAAPSDLLSQLKLSKGGKVMTLAEIEANFHIIVMAGSETVATALSGTINYLCQNAAVLKTLTDEVRSAVPQAADLTLANLSQLPILTSVLKEGLRVVSPVPIGLPRIVPAGGAFIDDYWIPGRTIVAVSPFATAHSATNFHQPSAFLPERWLDSAASSLSSHFAADKRDASQHFGAGARDCLGRGVAWAEMRLILAGLIWAFDIEAVRAMDWTQQKTYIVWQKEPFEVRLRRRMHLEG